MQQYSPHAEVASVAPMPIQIPMLNTLPARLIPITDHELAARLPLDGTIFQGCAAEFFGFFSDGGEAAGHQAGNIIYYAKKIHNAYRAKQASEDLGIAANDLSETEYPDPILDELPAIANKYAPSPENLTRDNKSVMQRILEELEGKRENDLFRFGIMSLDRIIDGVPPGALVTIAAQSSHGKSTLLGQAALKCADKDGKAVLYFAVEGTTAEMYKRWAAYLSRQPIKGGDRKQLIGGLSRVERLQNDGLLHVFPVDNTIDRIKSDSMAYARRCELGVIVVDYIQIIDPPNGRDQRERQISRIVMELKNLATRIGVPVLTGSQLNQQGEVRESQAIKQTSNVLIQLTPEETTKPVCEMDVDVRKNRDGEIDIAYAIWEKPLYTIRDKEAHDLPNYDAELDDVAADSLPGIVNQARSEQPDWS